MTLSDVLGFTKAKEIKGPPPRSEPFVENEAVVVPSSSGSLQAAVSDGRDVLPSAVKSIIKPRLQNRSTRAFYAKFARQDWVSTYENYLQPYATTVASDGSTIEAVTASYGKVMTGLDALERT
ncbi:hypothetical protein MPER_03656 [Moniliophthora perniciosa FA553]|nr:hypothetical protein MPER_03656 [Moniliophthora perniciosa FA553]